MEAQTGFKESIGIIRDVEEFLLLLYWNPLGSLSPFFYVDISTGMANGRKRAAVGIPLLTTTDHLFLLEMALPLQFNDPTARTKPARTQYCTALLLVENKTRRAAERVKSISSRAFWQIECRSGLRSLPPRGRRTPVTAASAFQAYGPSVARTREDCRLSATTCTVMSPPRLAPQRRALQQDGSKERAQTQPL